MRLNHTLLLLPFFFACGEKDSPSTDDTAPVEGDADTDSDADSDSDSDADTDADSDADTDLASVRLEATSTALSSRDTVRFSLTAVLNDGSESDVTDLAAFSSGDEDLLRFFAAPVGQPLGGGDVTVTGEYEGLSDELTLTVTLAPAGPGDLVFNELLIDGAAEGDPNGDGNVSGLEDEFVEIGNLADATLDLSGVTLSERDAGLPRHTFAEGTWLRAGEVIVVFGGGDVSNLSADNAWFVVADNEDPGEALGLALTNSGDTLSLTSAAGDPITRLSYGSADFSGAVPSVSDASLQLDVDIWGSSYEAHDASGGAAYSPGVKRDGAAFEGVEGSYDGQ